MNDFTKNMAQALFNQDKINDLLRKELQQAVNERPYNLMCKDEQFLKVNQNWV